MTYFTAHSKFLIYFSYTDSLASIISTLTSHLNGTLNRAVVTTYYVFYIRFKLMHVHVAILIQIRGNFGIMWLRLPTLKQLGLLIRLVILLVKRIYVVCGRIILRRCTIRQTLPLHPCGQLTRCFSAVAELLVYMRIVNY